MTPLHIYMYICNGVIIITIMLPLYFRDTRHTRASRNYISLVAILSITYD